MRSCPDICFISFAVTEFDTLGGQHAMAFLMELAKKATAS
jgi:hypothetical protein